MSSFAGHCLAGLTAYVFPKRQSRGPAWWGLALVGISSAPDIDYLIRGLRQDVLAPPDPVSLALCNLIQLCPASNGAPARITHSIIGVLVVPVAVMLLLWLSGRFRGQWWTMSAQAAAAGLSHLLLDLMVDVSPMPLLWPFSYTLLKLPFGILPSAPLISLTNFYFYRNLLIELGVLLPIAFVIYWLRHRYNHSYRQTLFIGALSLVSLGFMAWGYTLVR
ncbi:MAG: metal-dependent hydrolase [Anaerolineae bacterium]